MNYTNNNLCSIWVNTSVFLLMIFFIPFSSFSQKITVAPSFGLHGTGHKFFIDAVKEKNGHVFYAGIGLHTNALNGDRNGRNNQHFYAYNFSQLLSYKIGYRKLIGVNKEAVRFYPYCELVLSNIGLNMNAFFPYRSGQAEYVNVVEKNATPYVSANVGFGADIPVNKNFSLLAQAGICPTFSFATGPAYEWLVEPTWQIGMKIKL